MPIIIDPKTRQRIVVDQFCSDVVYTKKGDPAVSNEDVPFIASYQDYTGSKSVTAKQRLNPARFPNRFQGQDANIEHGAKLGNITDTGENADIKRERPIKTRVDIDISKRRLNISK